MIVLRDFVYIIIMYSMISFNGGKCSSDSGQLESAYIVKSERTPHDSQWETTLHGAQRETTPHDEQRKTTLHGEQREPTPHDGQWETTLHVKQRETTLHGAQRETTLHGGERKSMLYGGLRETTPHGNQREKRPQDGLRETTPDTDQKETAPHDRERQTESLDGQRPTTIENIQINAQTEELSTINNFDPCHIEVMQWATDYFHSQLSTEDPQFVQFKIKQVGNTRYNTTENVFEPLHWSWTFKDASGPLPFISWKLDHGILSFHLLETKTIALEHEIELSVSKECNITYGSDQTVETIVNAFVPLINVSADGTSIQPEYVWPTYPESYFCYYQINPVDFTTANNIFHYFMYNLKNIEYKCAVIFFDHTSRHFVVNTTCEDCMKKRHKWEEFGEFTLVFAVLSLLFCSPIIVFSVGQWMAKHEKIIANEVDEEYQINGDPFEIVNFEPDLEDDWLYADGINHPLNISDVFSFDTLGVAAQYPAFIGRLRRFLFILMVPLFIYLELIMFKQGIGVSTNDKITVKSFVKRRVPMGFLSLLGDPENRKYCFVYWLGGPVGVTCLYFSLSFLFIVLPRSLKQIIEDGLPSSEITFKSPLFLTFYQTMLFSKVINRYSKIPSGYPKAIVVIKCRFYMLFSLPFWQYVWTTQRSRWSQMCSGTTTCKRILKLLSLPLYLAICVIEIFCCMICYAIPFCSFVTIVVKGATKSLEYLQRQNQILRFLLSFRISFMFVFIVFTLYTYIISLIFMKSLLFICQIIAYCFLAVIMYPSVAFGYLFFFTVMLYYLIGLVRSFSDSYMEFLLTAVELSRQVYANTDHVYNSDGHLNVNLKMNQITDVKINGKLLDVSQDILRSLETVDATIKVRENNGVYGIPKELFDKLVKIFRPVHREVLSLCFKVAVIIVFVAALFIISTSIKSGPNTEISEVMHVMFIVVVGALPKLISTALSHSHDMLLKEIEERRIKDVIITYWQNAEH